MAEENTASLFNQAWMESQKQYWEAWGKLARDTMAQAPQAQQAPHLTQGLEFWWNTVAPMVPEQGREVFQRFVEQGKQYLQFNEQFLKNLQNMSQVPTTPEAWQKFWEQSMGSLQDNMGKMPLGGEHMAWMWNPVMEQWRKTATQLSRMPTHNLLNMSLDGYPNMSIPGMDEYQKNMDRMLAMPGVGYTREWQEQSQALARLWMAHQQAYRDYNEIFSRVGVNTVKRFQDKIMALSGSENPVSTLRELYDLWVDCAEDAYAEMVNTEEYSQANARLVNTLMAWKREGRQMLDETLSMLGLPSRRELDSVHKRLHQLRKQQHTGGDTAMKAELEALRAEVEALKQHSGGSPAPARRTATRKTTAAKGE